VHPSSCRERRPGRCGEGGGRRGEGIDKVQRVLQRVGRVDYEAPLVGRRRGEIGRWIKTEGEKEVAGGGRCGWVGGGRNGDRDARVTILYLTGDR